MSVDEFVNQNCQVNVLNYSINNDSFEVISDIKFDCSRVCFMPYTFNER